MTAGVPGETTTMSGGAGGAGVQDVEEDVFNANCPASGGPSGKGGAAAFLAVKRALLTNGAILAVAGGGGGGGGASGLGDPGAMGGNAGSNGSSVAGYDNGGEVPCDAEVDDCSASWAGGSPPNGSGGTALDAGSTQGTCAENLLSGRRDPCGAGGGGGGGYHGGNAGGPGQVQYAINGCSTCEAGGGGAGGSNFAAPKGWKESIESLQCELNSSCSGYVQLGYVESMQTLKWTSSPPYPASVGGTYTPTAVSSSGLPVTITVDPSSRASCYMDSAGVIHFTGGPGGFSPPPGGRAESNPNWSCFLDANQAGCGAGILSNCSSATMAYAPAMQIQQPVQRQLPQSIRLSNPPNAVFGGSGRMTASGGPSYNVVTASIENSKKSVVFPSGAAAETNCTISSVSVFPPSRSGRPGSGPPPSSQPRLPPLHPLSTVTLSFTGAGSCTLLATLPGTAPPPPQAVLTTAPPFTTLSKLPRLR